MNQRLPGRVFLARHDKGSQAGFTLLELLVVCGVVLLLVSIFIPAVGTFRGRAKKAKCLSQMRVIHAGFVGHIQDVGRWPQMPEAQDEANLTEDEFFRFWVAALEPYGVNEDTWLCPSDRKYDDLPQEAKEKLFKGSYIATRFDDKAATPFRWNQPWLMERAGFHGKGVHVLMPDGSVNSADNPFAGR